MSVTATPSFLNFFKSASTKSFVIKNHRQSDVEISVEVPPIFDVFPRVQTIKSSEECVFYVRLVSRNIWKSGKASVICKSGSVITTIDVKLIRHVLFGVIDRICGSSKSQSPTTETNPPTSSSPSDPDFLECKVCFQEYDDGLKTPRSLNCGHTICTECAGNLWGQGGRRRLICPFDRRIMDTGSATSINCVPPHFWALEVLEDRKKHPPPPPPTLHHTPGTIFPKTATISKKHARLAELIRRGNRQKQDLNQRIQLAKNCSDSFHESSSQYHEQKNRIEELFELKKRETLRQLREFAITQMAAHREVQKDLETDLQMVGDVVYELEQIARSESKVCNVGDVADLGMVLGTVESRRGEVLEQGTLDSVRISLTDTMDLRISSGEADGETTE